MSDEMKFLLVGTLTSKSVWLHVDQSKIAGLSVWNKNKLCLIEHPAKWVSPYLWLSKVIGLESAPLPAPALDPMLIWAGEVGLLAFREHCLGALADSMLTQFGYQMSTGFPIPTTYPKQTIAKVYAVEVNSGNMHMVGLKSKARRKTVLS